VLLNKIKTHKTTIADMITLPVNTTITESSRDS
jgi:hypothetical protein